MKIYKKLIDARNMLHTKELTKSGHNKFAGYKYFELADFLPTIQQIFQEVGLVDVISFDSETASMALYDVEDGSFVVFESPMGSASLKGCHEVQNIGAVETYQRRYLYTTAMAIVESDALDATTAKEEPKPKGPFDGATSQPKGITAVPITAQQISSINALIEQTQSDESKLCAYFKKPSIALLDRVQANNAIEMLNKKLFDKELENRSLNSLGESNV
jgi:hypothetical protein